MSRTHEASESSSVVTCFNPETFYADARLARGAVIDRLDW